MIVAHLSDLHLGYSAYSRVERGRNVRERDVTRAFERAVEALLELSPDLVLVAGDVFDRPDPTPAALVALTRGLEALGRALPDTPVLMVAGARDTPRRPGDAGALDPLSSFPGVQTATGGPRSISVAGSTVHVAMVPHRAGLEEPPPAPRPDPEARFNVLLAYARMEPGKAASMEVDPAAWDYVALGSEHVAREIAPHVRYAGSLERVGPTPWAEASVEKGFVSFDLETRRSTFHPIPGRAVVALAPIRVREAGALVDRLREVTEEVPGGIDGKIVHVTLSGIPASHLVSLQGDYLASLRARALHLSIEVEEGAVGTRAEADVQLRLRAELEGSGFGTRQHLALLSEVLDAEARP